MSQRHLPIATFDKSTAVIVGELAVTCDKYYLGKEDCNSAEPMERKEEKESTM